MCPLPLRRFEALARRSLALAIGLICAALLFTLTPREASADTVVSLFKSFAGNINYITTGNTLRAAPNGTYAGGAPCTLLSGNTGTSVDAGTSSDPISGIPAGSTIVAAYLYYAGSGATVDSAVTFNGTNVTASRTFTSTIGGHNFFSGYVDVTSLVSGNGTYSFGGLSVDNSAGDNCSNSTVLAGWALVVIYSNSSEKSRVINVFDGFEAFAGSSINLTPNNFQIPSTGIDGKFSVITWEGDPDINSTNGVNTLTETLEFNGNVLADACNPTADTSLPNGSNGGVFVSGDPNQYNSTINTLSCTGTLTPTGDEKYFGVDFDTFDVSPYLAAGQTSANTFYSTGQDTVFLTAQIVSVANTPVADLSITKTHTGNVDYGANANYSLIVTNNGPATETGTTTVSDTLPAGETYVSATGTGWTCGAAGQVVTCTNPSTGGIVSGASYPAITLTVAIAQNATSPLSNTATVSGTLFDNVAGNNSSTDTVTLVHPDLSTSTKTVTNLSGGNYAVGNTVQYTITLTESNGGEAGNVSVVDDVPPNLSNFTVTSFPAGATNSSTSTGGANNDGQLNITGITVPANSSVSIVFTAQVAVGTPNCTSIDNTATITVPGAVTGNTTNTASAPTIFIAPTGCASGNKVLYLYDNTTGQTYTNLLNRVQQTANTNSPQTVNGGASYTWSMSPGVATGRDLVLSAGTVTVTLVETATGTRTGNARATTVTLLNNGAAIATSGNVNVSGGARAYSYTITVPATTVLAGTTLGLTLTNGAAANRNVAVSQMTAVQGRSTISFATSTVINVDSITTYSGNYTGTGTPALVPVFQPSLTGHTTTVYICAVISDPFGSYDVTSANITLTDPASSVKVNGAAMTLNGGGGTDCSGNSSAAASSFEYVYTIPVGEPTGFWNISVTGHEGTEATVTQTSTGSFDVDVPSLLVMKTVAVASSTLKAIPGQTVIYTVMVQNNGRGPTDTGLTITDPVPTNTVFYVSSATPFTFSDGGTTGLSAPTMSFSSNGGTSWTYVPTCLRPPTPTPPCSDPAINDVMLTFTGSSMIGKIGATTPAFTITYQVVVQ